MALRRYWPGSATPSLRFGDNYRHFGTGSLDDNRVRLYRFAMHLSLVAGPLRLLDGDFPDRASMLGIVEHNIEQTLARPNPGPSTAQPAAGRS